MALCSPAAALCRTGLRTHARTFATSVAATAGDQLKHVAVVGSGPAGFYTAKYLLQQDEDVRVDVLDMLPTPFGLVRSGVAPDHQKVKSVQNDFMSVAEDERFRFLGNVGIGRDLSVDTLACHYNAVVLAYGAASDRTLGIPGEDSLSNILSARSFVNWYNGHPDFTSVNPFLDCEDVVVVGQGNVAVDCARILAKSVDELKVTDIADYALEALSASRVKRVHVVGRRGHVQASFTMKELRELTRLEAASFVLDPKELAAGLTPASVEEIDAHRARKRMNSLLADAAEVPADPAKPKEVHLRFLLSPVEFLPHADDATRVGAVRAEINHLEGEADAQRAVGTGRHVTIPAGLVLESIGYKSVAVDGVPFDETRNVVRNVGGMVVEEDGAPVPGLFCCGWLKRGPSGIVGTNIACAKETVGTILQASKDGLLRDVPADVEAGLPGIMTRLRDAGRDDLVTWDEYLKIDAAETSRGSEHNRPRQKMVTVEEMVTTAKA